MIKQERGITIIKGPEAFVITNPYANLPKLIYPSLQKRNSNFTKPKKKRK